MLFTPHVLAGAVIGSFIPSLPLVIILSLISHYTLDLLPHCDQGTLGMPKIKQYLWAIPDILVGIALVYYLYSKGQVNDLALVGAGVAVFPDFLDNIPYFSDWHHQYWPFKQINSFHEWLQQVWIEYHLSLGILTQVIIIGLSLFFLVKY
jgi:hypothetical protein